MASTSHVSRTARVARRCATGAGVVLALSMLAAPAALAGKPDSGPAPNDPVTLDGFCAHPISFTNTTLKAKASLFDPRPDGSQVWKVRGMGVSVAMDLVSGATYEFKGGARFAVTTAADGSVRVDGQGADILAWYAPGDVSDLGPGVWDINGHLTEWYAADGSFVRAAFSGSAVNVCEALGA